MPESALKSSFSQSGFICQTQTNNSMGSQVNFPHIYKPPSKNDEVVYKENKSSVDGSIS